MLDRFRSQNLPVLQGIRLCGNVLCAIQSGGARVDALAGKHGAVAGEQQFVGELGAAPDQSHMRCVLGYCHRDESLCDGDEVDDRAATADDSGSILADRVIRSVDRRQIGVVPA
ncbi:hypothetical protein ACFV29_39940 [Streptomyces sp. NPDC059690]|uniref:hypothetical protein n=1 Tax=Streptomyces sp. NPDC059690 TaxID=3346907 RepID=UPI00369C9335